MTTWPGSAKVGDDDAVRVSREHGVGALILGEPGLRLGRLQQSAGAVSGGARLVVLRARCSARGHQRPEPPLLRVGLDQARAGGGDVAGLRGNGMCEIGPVQPHEGLSSPDRLADVDHALDDLTGHAKAEIALHACSDDAGENPLRRRR